MENATLSFTDDALVAIAKQALPVPARGLRFPLLKTPCSMLCMNYPHDTRQNRHSQWGSDSIKPIAVEIV